jgi:molecular chaperone GrpE
MNEPAEKPDMEETQGADQAAPANDDPQAAIRALQALLDDKDRELAEAREQVLRARAEADNTRKRAERELADRSKYAVTAFARDLVNVLENLQRALASIPAELKEIQPAVAGLATGVEMTLQELLGAFERQGIRRIDPLGQKFDHNFHQAVAQIDTPDAEPGTIVQVLQAGYVIHDRLLRPAMVGVATKGAPAKQVDTQA